MKNNQKISELQKYANYAKADGLACRKSKNAGGWVELANACGAENITTRSEAREFLRHKFKHHGCPSDLKKRLLEYDFQPKVKTLAVKPKPKQNHNDVKSVSFLETYQWRRLRMEALKKYGPKCMCCGATPKDGAVMNVDHIKPRKLFPELALDLGNLQILCHECNHGKGNWDQTDWR
jgi:5-methylcytosine-specific restriction endonuclease McrA